MSQKNDLYRYIPPGLRGVVVREEYFDIVQRIGEIIPDDLVWEIFSSRPSETGGKLNFLILGLIAHWPL